MLDELDTEHRSWRLMEELDRCAREQHERHPQLAAMRQWARGKRQWLRGVREKRATS